LTPLDDLSDFRESEEVVVRVVDELWGCFEGGVAGGTGAEGVEAFEVVH